MISGRKRILAWILGVAACAFGNVVLAGGPPVIPGGAGFGIDTPAGRGGKIFRVTNLQDTGSGSLRDCVEHSGPRVCVFEISGTIKLASNLSVSHPRLTIAGQTAPEPGILLRGATLEIRASDVLVQHIAVRVGDDKKGPKPEARDAVKIISDSPISNIVIDHVSLSWSVDETLELWKNWDNVTISNSIIAQPLHDSLHPKGPHGLTVLIGSDNKKSSVSMTGNLLAHGYGRNPRSAAGEFVLVNNVVYNAKDTEAMLYNDGRPTKNSIVGNVFIKGQDSYDAVKPLQLVGSSAVGVGTALIQGTRIYLDDNRASCATDDPWSIVMNSSELSRKVLEVLNPPAWPDGLVAASADDDDALEQVLRNAGSRPAERNDVDARIITDVRNGTGRIINCVSSDGSKRCARNAGGWPKLETNRRRLEIPDDPGGDDDGDGYTNLEEWLHGMAAQVEGRGTPEDVPDVPPLDDQAPPRPPRLQ